MKTKGKKYKCGGRMYKNGGMIDVEVEVPVKKKVIVKAIKSKKED